MDANVLAAFAMVDNGVQRLLAASENGKRGVAAGFVDRIYPGVLGVPLSGSNAEDLLRLAPDATLAWNVYSKKFMDVGVRPVIQLRADGKSQTAAHLNLWMLLGQITGQSPWVDQVLTRYLDQVAIIEGCLSKSLHPPIKVVTVTANSAGLWIGGRANYYNELLSLAGAVNPAKEFNSRMFGLEQLMLMEPDAVLLTNGDEHFTPRSLDALPEMNALRAVRTHRVYWLPDQPLFSTPVMDPLLVRWMAELFYPDAMPKELRNAYRSTYRDVFHYALSDDEIDEALFMKENAGSAGYERFAGEGGAPNQSTRQDDGEDANTSAEIQGPQRCRHERKAIRGPNDHC